MTMHRIGDGLSPRSDFWWWIHLSRLAIRLTLQTARVAGKRLNTPESWGRLNSGWIDVLRAMAEIHAHSIGKQTEPDEVAKLDQITTRFPDGRPRPDAAVKRERAVFLSRWFPVPKPGEAGPESWTREQLRDIARWVVRSVDESSDAWPESPEGWRQSMEPLMEQLKEQLRR